jgi:hypothetical protein
MSQENLEIVRRWVWAFEHGTETLLELVHPALEWAPFEENHTIFHGVEGATQIRAGWLDAWAEQHIEIEEMIDRGDDVIAGLHLVAAGQAASTWTCGSTCT